MKCVKTGDEIIRLSDEKAVERVKKGAKYVSMARRSKEMKNKAQIVTTIGSITRTSKPSMQFTHSALNGERCLIIYNRKPTGDCEVILGNKELQRLTRFLQSVGEVDDVCTGYDTHPLTKSGWFSTGHEIKRKKVKKILVEIL